MNIKKSLFFLIGFLLTNPKLSSPMISASVGGLNPLCVEPVDLSASHIIEVNSLFSNGSYFGTPAHQQDNFHANYSTINLLHESATQHIGLNTPSLLDHIADRLLNSQDSTHSSDSTLSYNQGTSDAAPVNNSAIATNVTVELHDLCDASQVPQENPINIPVHSDAFRFSSDSAHENKQAEDFAYASNESEANYYRHESPKQNTVANNKAALRQFELLISSSYDPKALAVQIDTSLSKTYFSRRIFHETTQAKYRDFLWDSKGNFKPIDNAARQEQAFNILYGDIKNYFGWSNKAGLINFLEKQVGLKIPGAQRLLDLETGIIGFRGHIANVGNNISSAVSALNFLKGTPTLQKIQQGNFLKHLSKIVALCKAEMFTEARRFTEQIRQNICSTPEGERIATIDEYNCLCNVCDNIYKSKSTPLGIKLEYTKDPFYTRFEGALNRGAMKPHEAMKILEARDYAFKSISHRMGYEPKKLSEHDKNLIYKEIDSKTKNSLGLKDLYDRKDLLTDHELITLKEKLECFITSIQANSESTAANPIEETELIEPVSQVIQQEITVSPPPLKPEEPKEKEEKTNSQNTEIKQEGLKGSSAYKRALVSIERNTARFEKLHLKNLSKTDLKHIINNHTKIGEIANKRTVSNKTSLFEEGIDLIDLILEAWEFGKEVGPNAREYNCERIIGTSKDGIPTSIVKVVLNGTKDAIRTAYPR